MRKKDIDKLLAGRAVIDEYRAKGQQGIDESPSLAAKLKELGFTSDNPVDEFFAFNTQMGILALKETPVLGECDLCQGYAGTPECQIAYGPGSCASKQNIPAGEYKWKIILLRLRKGDIAQKGDWQSALANFASKVDAEGRHWICPKGHGFYIEPLKYNASPFDLTWE